MKRGLFCSQVNPPLWVLCFNWRSGNWMRRKEMTAKACSLPSTGGLLWPSQWCFGSLLLISASPGDEVCLPLSAAPHYLQAFTTYPANWSWGTLRWKQSVLTSTGLNFPQISSQDPELQMCGCIHRLTFLPHPSLMGEPSIIGALCACLQCNKEKKWGTRCRKGSLWLWVEP